MMWITIYYRRIMAIKLAWFILVVEFYRDIKSLIIDYLSNAFLKRAADEARKKNLLGVGQTNWYKIYLKLRGTRS